MRYKRAYVHVGWKGCCVPALGVLVSSHQVSSSSLPPPGVHKERRKAPARHANCQVAGFTSFVLARCIPIQRFLLGTD